MLKPLMLKVDRLCLDCINHALFSLPFERVESAQKKVQNYSELPDSLLNVLALRLTIFLKVFRRSVEHGINILRLQIDFGVGFGKRGEADEFDHIGVRRDHLELM